MKKHKQGTINGKPAVACLGYSRKLDDGNFYYVENGTMKWVKTEDVKSMEFCEVLDEYIKDHQPEWFI